MCFSGGGDRVSNCVVDAVLSYLVCHARELEELVGSRMNAGEGEIHAESLCVLEEAPDRRSSCVVDEEHHLEVDDECVWQRPLLGGFNQYRLARVGERCGVGEDQR